jgi:hypothetical protein
MIRNSPLTIAALLGAMSVSFLAYAEARGAPQREAPRVAAPRFQPHTAGIHPRGATVRPHATRVLAPRVVAHGSSSWSHWSHPSFVRPVYYWDWAVIRSVSCVAEDSYGDQYPVTEAEGSGFGLSGMTSVEDSALDRCYSESGQDGSCYLASCSHY